MRVRVPKLLFTLKLDHSIYPSSSVTPQSNRLSQKCTSRPTVSIPRNKKRLLKFCWLTHIQIVIVTPQIAQQQRQRQRTTYVNYNRIDWIEEQNNNNSKDYIESTDNEIIQSSFATRGISIVRLCSAVFDDKTCTRGRRAVGSLSCCI